MGKAIANLRQYRKLLRDSGFTLDYKSSAGGARMEEWKQAIDGRRIVIVQLWDDGAHRVTHSVDGCMDTPPTEFRSVELLTGAVIVESDRKDNRKFLKGEPR